MPMHIASDTMLFFIQKNIDLFRISGLKHVVDTHLKYLTEALRMTTHSGCFPEVTRHALSVSVHSKCFLGEVRKKYLPDNIELCYTEFEKLK